MVPMVPPVRTSFLRFFVRILFFVGCARVDILLEPTFVVDKSTGMIFVFEDIVLGFFCIF